MKPKTKQKQSPAAVHFELEGTVAREVYIAGSFNDWHPKALPMVDLGGGRWAKDLVLPPGSHEYLFVVDDQWRSDPRVAARVPNPFGGVNSVVTVPGQAAS